MRTGPFPFGGGGGGGHTISPPNLSSFPEEWNIFVWVMHFCPTWGGGGGGVERAAVLK